jgi:hypothetical protein
MNNEDDEFNRIERESKQRMEAVYQEVQKRNKAMDREYVRPWVGLTDDETADLVHRYAFYNLVRAVEDKLREKNT